MNLTGVEEAIFSRKNVAAHYNLPSIQSLEKPLKINVLCALRGSFRLYSSCEKRGALNVSNYTWPFFSVLAEKKGVTGTIDPTAFYLVINRQNVCFRR